MNAPRDWGLACVLARRYLPRGFELEDARTEAWLELEACRPEWDPAKSSWSRFASWRVRHRLQVLSGVRRATVRRAGRPVALDATKDTVEGAMSLHDVIASENPDPCVRLELLDAMSHLEGRARRIVVGTFEGATDEELAAREGIAVSTLRVQRSQAVAVMRERVGACRDEQEPQASVLDRVVALLQRAGEAGLRVREISTALRVRRTTLAGVLGEGVRSGRVRATGRTQSRRFHAPEAA